MSSSSMILFLHINQLVFNEGRMRKKGFLVSILLIFALSLFASPSWIGVQALGWQSDRTSTATYSGNSATSSGTDEGIGILLSGSLYPESEYPYGLGFQFGATKSTKGKSLQDSGTPLAWRGALTSQYGATISEFVTLEAGTGLLYEKLSDTYVSGGVEKRMTVKSFSLYSSVNLMIQWFGYLSLVGGVSMAIPLFATAELESGGITTKPDMQVSGYSLEALIGLAMSL